ncbi:MAG: rhamnulokinase family protein [Gemmataceae bacterium]
MATKKLLAFDLGAESGRGLLASFDGAKLQLEDVHRFPNGGVRTLNTLHWDVLGLYREIVAAMRKCGLEHGTVASIGIDTWGVDFALIGRDGTLLGNPRHHRDLYTETIMDEAFQIVPKAEIFRQTGLQFLRFNSLFQLLALRRDGSPWLEVADRLLLIPDLLNYFLTGIKANEYTDASTSQMLDPETRDWNRDLLAKFELPDHIFGDIIAPGTVLGPLHPHLIEETSLKDAKVIAPATHDTASAVAAVPARAGTNWAYISSGTWSLMGAEIEQPLLDEQTHKYNFTNEGGVDGTIRLLKNIMGLWLVQECRRCWERDGTAYAYDKLTRLAEDAPPFVSLVNPDDPSFMLPPNMPNALAEFCKKTNQPAPQEPGPVIRCALESLALRYRWVLGRLEELLGKKFDAIHVVGGGSRNALLCQFTADACNCPVYAGPVEATAIGNVLVQGIGLGLLKSLDEAREVVGNSFEVTEFRPQNPDQWNGPYDRFLGFLE